MKRLDMYITEKQEESIGKIIEETKLGTKSQHIRNAIDEYIEKYYNTDESNKSIIEQIKKMDNEGYRAYLKGV